MDVLTREEKNAACEEDEVARLKNWPIGTRKHRNHNLSSSLSIAAALNPFTSIALELASSSSSRKDEGKAEERREGNVPHFSSFRRKEGHFSVREGGKRSTWERPYCRALYCGVENVLKIEIHIRESFFRNMTPS